MKYKTSTKEIECKKFAKKFTPVKVYYNDWQNSIVVSDSSIKTFIQLWSDYGLRDFGYLYCDRKFSYDDKLECIQYWSKVLYEKDFDLESIEREIVHELSENRNKVYASDLTISHINSPDPIDCMPDYFDKLYGNYDNINSLRNTLNILYNEDLPSIIDLIENSIFVADFPLIKAIHTGFYFRISTGFYFELMYSFEKRVVLRQPLDTASRSNRKSFLGVVWKKKNDLFFRVPDPGILNGIYEIGGRVELKDYCEDKISGHHFNYAQLKEIDFYFFDYKNYAKTILQKFPRLKIIETSLYFPKLEFYIELNKELSLREYADKTERNRIDEQNYRDAIKSADDEINGWDSDFSGWSNGRD